MKHLKKIFALPVLFSVIFGLCTFAFESSALANERGGELTYDLGVSTGERSSVRYTEANLGLNFFATDWLAWRNSIFGRFQTGRETAYGLDTSLRLMADAGDGQRGFSLFLGPGYRLASGIDSAPFAEAGLIFHLAGLNLGAGAKQIFNSVVKPGTADDFQYFVILGGGGRLL